MMKQILCSLLVLLFFASCENRYRRGVPSSHATVDSKFVGQTGEDSYQVSKTEYEDNFVSRYGLLYLKAGQEPFSGRILTVDIGDSGEFVSSDESWKEGRKHGKSSKWFSNGIKMYERNYKEGRWHGSVTRWWPNGQKMYVRAYTNGVRHGKEATWRSDGTPLSLPENGLPTVLQSDEELIPEATDNFIKPAESSDSENMVDDLEFNDPAPSFEAPILDISESSTDPVIDGSDDAFSDLPDFPPAEDSLPDFDEEMPVLQDSGQDSLPLPDLDAIEAPSDDLSLPEDDSISNELPGLPGLDIDEQINENDAPALPPISDDSDAGGLPPLPGLDDAGLPPLPGLDDGGLPPLPGGGDDGLGDLPPLPPLP